MERYEVTMKEITRYKVIKKWEEGKVRGKEVSVLLGISYRQALRLRRRFRHEGMKELIDRRSGHRGIRDEGDSLRCKRGTRDDKYREST